MSRVKTLFSKANVIQLTFAFLFVFFLTGCIEKDDFEFKGIEDKEIVKINGKEILLNLKVRISNNSSFPIRIRPSDLQVFLDNDYISDVKLLKSVRIKSHKERVYEFPLKFNLSNGAIFKIAKSAFKKQLEVGLKGKLKLMSYGFPKKFDLDETITLDGAKLNLSKWLNN
jgi:LEA14-like dessication related protein